MRQLFFTASLLGLASSSFAIAGLGFHYAPNMGASADALTQEAYSVGSGDAKMSATLDRGKVDGLQGFGAKLWIDAIPYIDVEVTGNLQFGTHDTRLIVDRPTGVSTRAQDTIDVKADLGLPGLTAKAGLGAAVVDASITYPFLKFPPAVSLVKFYAGAGVTMAWQAPMIDTGIVKKVVKTQMDAVQDDPSKFSNANAVTLANEVGKALAEEGFEQSTGGHVLLGARAKLPVIPIAAYANYKYHFNIFKSPAKSGHTLEIGGGLAF